MTASFWHPRAQGPCNQLAAGVVVGGRPRACTTGNLRMVGFMFWILYLHFHTFFWRCLEPQVMQLKKDICRWSYQFKLSLLNSFLVCRFVERRWWSLNVHGTYRRLLLPVISSFMSCGRVPVENFALRVCNPTPIYSSKFQFFTLSF